MIQTPDTQNPDSHEFWTISGIQEMSAIQKPYTGFGFGFWLEYQTMSESRTKGLGIQGKA